jgi:hypothetical protein
MATSRFLKKFNNLIIKIYTAEHNNKNCRPCGSNTNTSRTAGRLIELQKEEFKSIMPEDRPN